MTTEKQPVSPTSISTGTSIKKSNKVSKKSKEESSDTSDRGDRGSTGDRGDRGVPVALVSCITQFNSLFSETIVEKTLRHFMETKNTQRTLVKLAEEMGMDKDSLRAAINRKKDYFYDTSVKGKAGVIQVDTGGIDEILSRIDRIEAEKQQILRASALKKEREKEQQNYQETLQKLAVEIEVEREGNTISLDFNKLLETDSKMADELLDNPKQFIETFKGCYSKDYDLQITNLPKSTHISIENIRKEHINKLITVEGRVVSMSEVRPITKEVKFECPSCGTIISIKQDYKRNELTEPFQCSCGRKGNFRKVELKEENACRIQLEDLQDKTDNPHSQRVKSITFNGLCEPINIRTFTPGNEVRAVGIIKRVPRFKNKKETLEHDWILEIKSVELIEKDIDLSDLTEEECNKIKELSKKIGEQGLTPLIDSFAPDIHGYEAIKGALILQLCNKRNYGRSATERNKSNILLIGDPGVAKSVLCNFSIEITPGARKAVGGGSSAVGLTASVVKDEDNMGGYRVEPGAMILAKDTLFIDELNNLNDDDKPKLQEGMNEQTVSINKANLHVQMKVSCGIIAAANPKGGHFIDNGEQTIEQQFNIPSPILNRFDTIFVVRDHIDSNKDELIAEKMIRRHRGILNNTYNKDFLKKFFAYIRQHNEPEIDNETEKMIMKVYSKARINGGMGVKINPRFLVSLIRMSISSAKLRQSTHIEEKDIKLAMRIISHSHYRITEDQNIKK